jgi:serine/threonine protein kinase
MGIVYKARDPFIGRMVALKTITSSLSSKPDLLARFYQEARSAGTLQHPNIVTIFELNKEGDTPYIVMEYLEGESVDKLVARQPPLALAQKVDYMVQVCRALEYAHKRGIVHRDIKPGNIVVTGEGSVKVVDFGIARLMDASQTQTGMVIGTLGYMSPQQIRGEHADERSDIWAVGAMFYELLSYQRAFHGDNPAALMMNIISKAPRPLKELVPDCPEDVAQIVHRMLEKESDVRFQSMEDVLLELDPVGRRLQQGRVSELVTEGEQLFQGKELQQAQKRLREALHLDGSNWHAKSLLEKVSAEIRRLQLVPKIAERMAKAQTLLESRQLPEAKAEVESALHLDSGWLPARELLVTVDAEIAAAEKVREKLRVARQRMADGALEAAEQQLDEALAIEPNNPQALELKNHIREETQRREKRRQFNEKLQSAHGMLSQRRYEDCIALLSGLQKEFPGDAEVAQMLEAARHDTAEHEMQGELEKARSCMSSKDYAGSLRILDELLERYPEYSAAQSLRNSIAREQAEEAKRRHLQAELAALRALMAEGKHGEAVKRGTGLLSQFPQEFELAEIIKFARAEQTRAEDSRKLAEKLRIVRELLDAKSFQEAVRSAVAGLAQFPGNADLQALLKDAQSGQQEKAKRDFVRKRVHEIQVNINRDDLTNAMTLARATLERSGEDSDVTRLLRTAEMEYEARENKRTEQERNVEAARTLIEDGNVDGATQILNHAIETRIFDPTDRRVRGIIEDIEKKKREVETPSPPNPATATPDFGQEYVFQQAGTLPVAPGLGKEGASNEVASTGLSATPLTARPAPGLTESAPPSPLPGKTGEKSELASSVASGSVLAPSQEQLRSQAAPAQPIHASPLGTGSKARLRSDKKAAKAKVKPQKAAAIPEPRAAAPGTAAWKRPTTIAVASLGAIAAVGGGYYALRPRVVAPPVAESSVQGTSLAASQTKLPVAATPALQVNPLEQKQRALMEEAQNLAHKREYAEALNKLAEAANLQGPLESQIQDLQKQITEGQNNAQLQELWDKEDHLWEQATSAFNQGRYDEANTQFRQIFDLSGKRKADAAKYIQEAIPNRKAEASLFDQAKALAQQTSDPKSLQQAADDLKRVMAYNGPQSAAAQADLTQVTQNLDKQQKIAGLQADASTALKQGSYQTARQKTDQLRQMGGNPIEMLNEIGREEQARFDQLVQQFSQAKDTQSLKQLQSDFHVLAGAAGPQVAGEANDYADKKIPEELKRLAIPVAAPVAPAAEVKQAVVSVLGEGDHQKWTGGPIAAYSMVGQKFLDDGSLKLLKSPIPPETTQRAAPHTEILLLLNVEPDGSVRPDRIGGPDASGVGKDILNAAKSWQFSPPTFQKKKVKTSVSVKVKF